METTILVGKQATIDESTVVAKLIDRKKPITQLPYVPFLRVVIKQRHSLQR
ncbi:hypothetical protein [Vagococcus jeotgali]|uniref:hypothetical protein n=1 Tax=Vagococcus jeotgali TaxID=3109030 RepID=UPI002DDC8CF6|nr:hypothetical protein [Vagococcus sp. B2T-5]